MIRDSEKKTGVSRSGLPARLRHARDQPVRGKFAQGNAGDLEPAVEGALPASRAAWSLPALADDPHAQVFRTQLRTAKRPPAVPQWPAIAAAIEVRLDALVRMHSDGREMAEQLDAAANSVGAR